MRKFIIAAIAVASIMLISAPAQAVPATMNSSCSDIYATWCQFFTSDWGPNSGEFMTGTAHNSYLYSGNASCCDPADYHLSQRPAGGGWGEMKVQLNNECWNYNPANNNIAIDSCDSTFHNTNELFYSKKVNNGSQSWIINYTAGTSWYIWLDNFSPNVRVTIDSHLDVNTELAVMNPI